MRLLPVSKQDYQSLAFTACGTFVMTVLFMPIKMNGRGWQHWSGYLGHIYGDAMWIGVAALYCASVCYLFIAGLTFLIRGRVCYGMVHMLVSLVGCLGGLGYSIVVE